MKFPDTQLSKEQARPFYELLGELRSLRNRPVLGRCMYWSGNCDAPPIGSHLLSRSWLEEIADDTNHILQLQMVTENLCNEPAQIAPRRVGVKLATTFPGFCEKHDDEIFACLEKTMFSADKKQLAALRYRSLCREACAKHQIVGATLGNALTESAPPHVASHIVGEMKRCMLLLKEKQSFEEARNNDDVQSYVVKFAKRPTVLVSATIHPLLTFTGRSLEFRPEWITVTILPSGNQGFAVFTWSKKAPKNSSLVIKTFRSLPARNQTLALIYLALEASENHAISPEWWNSLDQYRQQALMRRFGRVFISRRDPVVPDEVFVVNEKSWVDWEPVESYYV